MPRRPRVLSGDQRMRPSLSQKWQRSPPRWSIDGMMLGIPRSSVCKRQIALEVAISGSAMR